MRSSRLYRQTFTLGVTCIVMAVLAAPVWAGPGDRMIEAARRGDLDQVAAFLDEGVDANYLGDFKITALWQASSKGHVEVVRLLLERGADPNIKDGVWHVAPMMMAGDQEVLRLLLRHGAEPAAFRLRLAAMAGNVEEVELILELAELTPADLRIAFEHAEMAGHADLAAHIADAAGGTLPPVHALSPDRLERFAGFYVSQRLQEMTLYVDDEGRLATEIGGEPLNLIPVNDTTFVRGGATVRFLLDGDRVTGMVREEVFGRADYERRDPESVASESPGDVTLQLPDFEEPVAATTRWPIFRGPNSRGIATGQNLPASWDIPEGAGLLWKTPVPGLANSSPVLWDDRIFVTTAVSSAGNNELTIGIYGSGAAVDDESEHSFRVLCLRASTGEILWEREAEARVPPVKRHLKSTQANSTPATDGERVVVLFSSGGLYCYDVEGELLWSRDLGILDSGAFNDPDVQWGFGSSPILYRNMVLLQCDLQDRAFLAALDVRDGTYLWRAERDELPSWGTPSVFEDAAGPVVVTNGTRFARGYDAMTGEELWRLGPNAAITVPTPQAYGDLVYVTSGYRPIQPIYAVRPGARGDLTLPPEVESSEDIAWSKPRGGPYLPTPLVYGGLLYTCSNDGIFTCYSAADGRRLYRKRVGQGASSFTASPVAADGVVYVVNEAGTVYAIRAGTEFEVLSENPLGEYCLSTPAIAGGRFLVRTSRHLVAIGQSPPGNDN